MDNPTLILQTLDSHLDHPVRLVLYGRAALHLGFDNPPVDAGLSKDVDGIVPLSDLDSLTADLGFWDAQQATNIALRQKGLYITHLFRADQVFLRPGWEQHLVRLTRPSTHWLRLFRPATLDLILTKMMRGEDAQDMADVAFLIQHDKITLAQIEVSMAEAVIPDLAELREAFERAKPRVRALAEQTRL
jgi:hypothetical protein